jgi:glycosyl hydrolase family 106( putative alpha-L-rhamnosidase)
MNRHAFDLEAFRHPSREFGILPFWFLNGELDPSEMRFQLQELWDKGMQGVVLHGRFGLEMPYVGDTYLDRIRLAVEEARSLGLRVWIYDEMNWPSGTADKRVLRARPDLAQQYLECISFPITGPWFMCLTGGDSRYLDFEKSIPVAAFAIGEDGTVIDLTANLSFANVVPWEVPPGTWRLCYLVEKRADYYIDALDPESTQEFIRQGYQPYADRIGSEFSRDVVGFYSDEPAMHYFLSAADNAVVPWTKDLFRRFHERNGYDLRPRLPELFFDLRDDSARVRHDFYSSLTAFYSDAYYRQLRGWCAEHGVVFTAHLLYEEWLRRVVRVEGNLFSHYRNMDVVAVDHLYPVIGTRSSPDQHVAMKVASSAAHHFGSERLICESFGGIFMDATMQRMKWIADWEFVLGVNVLNPHGFHYTLEGPRKRDWPPSMFYQYPWWRYYDRFSAYMSRLSETLTGGRHVAKVAVLWPINAMFAEYLPQDRTAASDTIEGGLNVLTDRLLRLHYDFDYLDEDVLAEAEIADGVVRIRDEVYELVIVPPMTSVKVATVEALERFVEGGGALLGVLERPRRGLGAGAAVDVGSRMDALFEAARGRFVDGDAPAMIADALAGGPALVDRLFEAITELITPDVELDNEEIFVLHRVRDDRDVYFLANTTYEPQRGRMSIVGDVLPVLWDPSGGDELPAGPIDTREGRTAFDISLPPVGSTFVVVGDRSEPRIVGTNVVLERVSDAVATGHGDAEEGWVDVRSNGHVARAAARGAALPEPIALDGRFSFGTDDANALVLKSFRTSLGGDGEDDGSWSRPDAPDGDWLAMRPGAWSYQLAGEPDRPYPIPVRYRVPFDVDEVPERLELVIDGFDGPAHELFVNGEPLKATPVRSSFDSQMQSVEITPHVRAGRNVLGVRLTIDEATGGIVDNVKLMGPFALDGDEEGGYRIAAPRTEVEAAPWTEQGYPFLSGTGVYRRTVELPDRPDVMRLFLEAPIRDDVLEVHVNGEPAGVCLWDPYVVEITAHVRPGRNEITLSVTDTLANLLNGVPRPAGLAGPPRILARSSFEFDLRSAAGERFGGSADG